MNSVKVSFTNCYGINSLEVEFDFTDKKAQLIYAQNGMMKSSFAKTFDDIANGTRPVDVVYEKKPIFSVEVDSNPIDTASIYVVKSAPDYFETSKMSSLLVDEKSKAEYDQAVHDIQNAKEDLFSHLMLKTSLKSIEVEKLLLKTLRGNGEDVIDRLSQNEQNVQGANSSLNLVNYKLVFNQKVTEFLDKPDVKSKLEAYIKRYKKLLESSKYLKDGVFNHFNALEVQKSLGANGYFAASHGVILDGDDEPINDEKALFAKFEDDFQAIFNNPELAKDFKKFDGTFKNIDLRQFRDYLGSNQYIIPELSNLPQFKQQVILAYLKESSGSYSTLLKAYHENKKKIQEIIERAQSQKTEWQDVVDIFNSRFDVPFTLEVENKADVVLKDESSPQIAFHYTSTSGKAIINKDILINKVLSTGEKRALYILSIIFEIQARSKDSRKNLIILDDIADSFDYRNKYAIIEYLKEFISDKGMYLICLTHNFEFYRSMQLRFENRRTSYMAIRDGDRNLKLLPAAYMQPFKHFKDNFFQDKKIFISTISFVRNIIEYTEDDFIHNADYLRLTSTLHYKADTDTLKLSDIHAIFQSRLRNVPLEIADEKYIVALLECADEITKDTSEQINLENKIVLSIAIRYVAEHFMADKISEIEPAYFASIQNNKSQTAKLYEKYKELFGDQDPKVIFLTKVMIATPDNIHINSFMYEPILDLSDDYLKTLYTAIKNL